MHFSTALLLLVLPGTFGSRIDKKRYARDNQRNAHMQRDEEGLVPGAKVPQLTGPAANSTEPVTAAQPIQTARLPSLNMAAGEDQETEAAAAEANASADAAGQAARAASVESEGRLWQAIRNGRGNGGNSALSQGDQAKALLRKYGLAYLLTSNLLAIASFVACYSVVSGGADVTGLLKKLGLSAKVSGKAGNAAIAFVITNVLGPTRFPPTVALTPIVAEWLKI